MDLNKYRGLTSEEVEERIKAGKGNKTKKTSCNSYLKIIFTSFFTFSNVILYCLAILFLIIQLSFEDGIQYLPITKYGFLLIIFFNALISIISQIRSKKTIEKMELINQNKVSVIRNNELIKINSDEIVIDDLIFLKNNALIPVDLKIVEGEGYLNESVLTGESSLVFKKESDLLLSGSNLVDGEIIAKAVKVGDQTYIKKLENTVKKIKKGKSQLNKDLNKIVLYMVFVMIPCFIATFIKTRYIGQDSINWAFSLEVISKSSTIIVGMIPIGMVLLSSITLANSIIKLAKDKVMVKELYSIESLARIDTLALDKTGTITSNKLKLLNTIIYKKIDDFNLILSLYLSSFSDNLTSSALKEVYDLNKFSKEEIDKYHLDFKDKTIFTSKNKYSSLKINNDIYFLGSPDVLINDENVLLKIDEEAKKGRRILAFIRNDEVIAIFIIENELRKNIKETINYFSSLNIDIKVISGDNLLTVKEISRKAGIKNYDKAISLENVKIEDIKYIALNYNVFARATPEQKEEIIKFLEENGHKVGYIGDGVNDITSLRRATCSIALNSGVQSSKLISDFTLLNDDFSSLSKVIEEGRRTINNIKRSSSLFITKALLIALISIFSLFSPTGLFIEIESIYVFEFITVALCGFLLSIENNKIEKFNGRIIKEVIIKGLESALFVSLTAAYLIIINFFYPLNNIDVLLSLSISLSGFIVLYSISYPSTKYSRGILIFDIILTIVLLIAFPDVFLNPGYLKQADTFIEQIGLIIDDFFNFELFIGLSYIDYLIFLPYMAIASIIFIFISRTINKRLKFTKTKD